MSTLLATDMRGPITESLSLFKKLPFAEASRGLFTALGYSSERRITLNPNTAAEFVSQFGALNSDKAMTADWLRVDFLFQLTDEEIGNHFAFSTGQVDRTVIESYIFIAIHLKQSLYTRGRLATVAREINKLFPMPVMVLFRHGDSISLAVIDRELNRRDSSKDVLRKVTLIKDIRLAEPGRAHIEILNELALPVLYNEYPFHNFVELHRAWAKKLDSSDLNKRFYQEVSYWYLWAKNHPDVKLPKDVDSSSDEQRSIFFIRLLTRLIFCWFLQEKGLIPRRLFQAQFVREFLKDSSPDAGTYYKAVLQNLFFATLNRETEKRSFRDKKTTGRFDKNRGVTTLYRYEDLLSDKTALLKLFDSVPFVNGGLFDCLDDVYRKVEGEPTIRLDGFSDNPRESLTLPNELFFGKERHVDLSHEFDDKRKDDVPVRPFIEILSRYKFTVEENTPLEQEIALDPELLGKVFENLLASYNDDTKTIARKKVGAFYTPRDVVRYMVDESLIFHFASVVPESKLRRLLADQAESSLTPAETEKLIAAIEKTRILDPACGSGAFPMGALNRLVHMLSILDPNNASWKRRQREAALRDRQRAEAMEETESRETAIRGVETRLEDIEKSFDTTFHDLDYARKLYLIENSIFGVDIQPIACQIAKLRFFISLLVDQKSDKYLRPLPNLETRIVAADTLIPVEKVKGYQLFLGADQVERLRESLRSVRHQHFNARTPEAKQRFKERDETIRAQLSEELERLGMPNSTARLLATWNPYDQNSHASFFDPEWMFSLSSKDFSGFDIVIGNPPYVKQQKLQEQKPNLKKSYSCFTGTADLYVYFYERGLQLLTNGGIFTFITSNKWMRTGYGQKLRELIKAHTRIISLIDFGDAEIFDAIAYPCIIILANSQPPSTHSFRAMNWLEDRWSIVDVARHLAGDTFPMLQADLAGETWRLESKEKLMLLERISAVGIPLGDILGEDLYRGVTTGLNDAFVVDSMTRDRLVEEDPSSEELLKPYLRGRDIDRWKINFAHLYLIFTRRGIDITRYPAIHKHLKRFRDQLEPAPEGWDAKKNGEWKGRKAGTYKWFEVQDNIAYWQQFERPKILSTKVSLKPTFALEDANCYVGNTSYILPTNDGPFLLAILNSVLAEFYSRNIFVEKQNGYYEVQPEALKRFPIPQPTAAQRAKIVQLSTVIIDEGAEGSMAAYFERLLNGLVYQLFFPDIFSEHETDMFLLLAESGITRVKDKETWAKFYKTVSDVTHPVYGALFALNSFGLVRFIEGRE